MTIELNRKDLKRHIFMIMGAYIVTHLFDDEKPKNYGELKEYWIQFIGMLWHCQKITEQEFNELTAKGQSPIDDKQLMAEFKGIKHLASMKFATK